MLRGSPVKSEPINQQRSVTCNSAVITLCSTPLQKHLQDKIITLLSCAEKNTNYDLPVNTEHIPFQEDKDRLPSIYSYVLLTK